MRSVQPKTSCGWRAASNASRTFFGKRSLGVERFDPSLLEAGPERDLHDGFQRLPGARDGYRPALEAIASLRPQVDLFFDKVLVNAPDDRVRLNRLTLLSTILAEFSKIADFSEIATD